jgi:tRNA-(ms[2]io[6]A)-hydroxylase
MLHLASCTSEEWLAVVTENLDTLLLDHAHCEKKAASTVVGLIFRYPEYHEIMAELSEVAREELRHFEMLLKLLEERGIAYEALPPSPYAKNLTRSIRSAEPQQFLDRLLCCSLIEARSCERMKLLSESLDDPDLRNFYSKLLVSEARHHNLYVEIAEKYFDRDEVRRRLAELALVEAEIVGKGSAEPRMHS